MIDETIRRDVRLWVFDEAARTGTVPQAPAVARALGLTVREVSTALRQLAEARVLILAPNDGAIWAANPFCAVPAGFRVESGGTTYQGICVWDALGIPAALHADATVHAQCGDCGDPLRYRVEDGELVEAEGVIHFAVPARNWWDNIGYT